jgi:FkbM family methyltransferase
MPAEHDVDRLVQNAFFKGRTNGVLVEVGAARPDYLSIGASFRALGWTVISVEPNPEFCAAHRALGHDVLEYAVSDSEGDDVDFYVVDSNGADYLGGSVSFESWSSLGIRDRYADFYNSVKAGTSIRTIPVKVRTLVTILATHAPGLSRIDVLAVDVEGWELNVMRGLTRFEPKVVIMEGLFDDPAYVSYMEARGYKRWRRIVPNDVYVRRASPLRRLVDRLGHWYRRRVRTSKASQNASN